MEMSIFAIQTLARSVTSNWYIYTLFFFNLVETHYMKKGMTDSRDEAGILSTT